MMMAARDDDPALPKFRPKLFLALSFRNETIDNLAIPCCPSFIFFRRPPRMGHRQKST